MPLTPKQQRFVEEYLVDLNATQAAIRAGYSPKTAQVQGARLLSNAMVQLAIQAGQAARSQRTGITADQVLLRWWSIATANPNELIEYRRTCCRNCHGVNFGYQRTVGELARDRKHHEAALKKRKRNDPDPGEFDEAGGDGYDLRKPPHPECPECFGEGVGQSFAKDTRHLSPAALALYAGVRVTKEGLEVKMHDQAAALANAAKHLGMFVERHEHTGAGAQPIQHEHTLTARIDEYTDAFEGAANREEASHPPGHDPGKPVDP